MKYGVFVFIVMFLNSCINSAKTTEVTITDLETTVKVDSILNAQNFKREITYEPLSLHINGKPVLSPGQLVETLDSSFSFGWDVNGEYWDQINLIKDHLSMDSDLSIDLDLGSINGILFFSSDKIKDQIFNIEGGWLFETEVTNVNENEIIEKLTGKLFPCLKGEIEFKEEWKHLNKKANYVEEFSFNSPKENEGLHWSLSYKVEMI